MLHENSIARQILDLVKANPGITKPEIVAGLPEGAKRRSVDSITRLLREKGAIENRGGNDRWNPGRWYAVETPADPAYLQVAQDLLAELKNVHHTARETHLARRLEEIFG